jgi:hypothetical protein
MGQRGTVKRQYSEAFPIAKRYDCIKVSKPHQLELEKQLILIWSAFANVTRITLFAAKRLYF